LGLANVVNTPPFGKLLRSDVSELKLTPPWICPLRERQEYDSEPVIVASGVRLTPADGCPETTVGGARTAVIAIGRAVDVLLVKFESPP